MREEEIRPITTGVYKFLSRPFRYFISSKTYNNHNAYVVLALDQSTKSIFFAES